MAFVCLRRRPFYLWKVQHITCDVRIKIWSDSRRTSSHCCLTISLCTEASPRNFQSFLFLIFIPVPIVRCRSVYIYDFFSSQTRKNSFSTIVPLRAKQVRDNYRIKAVFLRSLFLPRRGLFIFERLGTSLVMCAGKWYMQMGELAITDAYNTYQHRA